MDRTGEEVTGLVTAIHDSGTRICLVVTGAGTRALAWLFGVPGASRTMLDAQVPYSVAALDDYAGGAAEQHVSADEAALMASAALTRATALAERSGLPPGTLLAGVACTATIATDRLKRGDHRCHVAWRGADGGRGYSLVLTKGGRSRDTEEDVVSRLILNAVAEACGVDRRLDLPLMSGETVARPA